jgi:hypothetical protein
MFSTHLSCVINVSIAKEKNNKKYEVFKKVN